LVRRLRKDGMKLKAHKLDSPVWIARRQKYSENYKKTINCPTSASRRTQAAARAADAGWVRLTNDWILSQEEM
jgi:hypothetical protein